MGKFDGYLICTDLDDTLLTSDKRVSEENKQAIEYFKSEGGLFTFATGRVPEGARLMLKYIRPNAPMVCFNGASIYDYEKEETLWSAYLDERAIEVAEFVDKNYPCAGIEVCSEKSIYFCKVNKIVEEHKILENFPDNYLDYHLVKEQWQKVMFMMETEYIDGIKVLIGKSEFANRYSFMQSSPWYYEMLPLGATKGNGMLKLAQILGIDKNKVIGMGDNGNDVDLVEKAGIGVAVENALSPVKAVADWITVNNNEHAAARVIEKLEKIITK